MQAAKRGTDLHELAHRLIRLGVKLPRTKETLNAYVNDAIGYQMVPEQVLVYSEFCFGTPDAIGFKEEKSLLRIHDLKTGLIPGNMNQLKIYAAMFCHEYTRRPGEIDIELRIYQNDEILVEHPDVEVIAQIMSKIVIFDDMIRGFELKLRG